MVSLHDLEMRMKALEAEQAVVRELVKEVDWDMLRQMVGLLHDVQGAMRIFIKIGNGLKWILVLGTKLALAVAAVSSAIAAWRKLFP